MRQNSQDSWKSRGLQFLRPASSKFNMYSCIVTITWTWCTYLQPTFFYSPQRSPPDKSLVLFPFLQKDEHSLRSEIYEWYYESQIVLFEYDLDWQINYFIDWILTWFNRAVDMSSGLVVDPIESCFYSEPRQHAVLGAILVRCRDVHRAPFVM